MTPITNSNFGSSSKLRALFEKLLVDEGIASEATAQIPQRSANERIPLSFAQERLWFLGELDPGSALYNIPMALWLDGALDVAALRSGLEEVVRRHEALRTRFETVAGRPVQVIEPIRPLEIPFVDLSELPEVERKAEVTRLCREEAQRPFDLGQDLMLRAKLLRLAPTKHMLFLNLHHIAADGWSVGVLLRELGSLYEAFCKGRASPLNELPIQYADFAVWQRDWLQGEALEKQLAYWKTQLEGAPALLELPTDRSRPARQSYRGATETAVFPGSLLKAVKALSRQEGASLFMTLLAAFQTLLSRYCGQEDIVVGSPIAGRNRVELEELIGFFVNTVALRGDLSGNPTFRELLRRMKEVTLGAYAHQDLPFEKLVEELQPERNLSYSPLFQVMFTLNNTSAAPTQLGGLGLNLEWISSGTSKFDLSMSMSEGVDGLKAEVEYCTDLFDAGTVRRMLGHYQVLLEGIVANPDARIGELPLLTESERHRLLVEWNQTEADYPRDKCVHQLFEAQAERTPDAIAVVFEDQQLTYRELNERSNQLAHHLRKLGIGPDVLVGLCVERSLEMLVGLLGILKAGGAYVPLDPTYPEERLTYMISDARLPVLVTQRDLLNLFPKIDAELVCLDSHRKIIDQESASNVNSAVNPDNLAYVIYTSGSTGWPKGVLVEHRGLCNVSKAQVLTFGLAPRDRVLQFASISFDASIFEILMALNVGATLCLGRPDQLMPGPDLISFLDEMAINIVTLPPSALSAMPAAQLPALRILTVAGEPCSVELIRQWASGRKFFNLYGPTEDTIWTTVAQCHPRLKRPSIGRPIVNTKVYILDRHRNPLPVGVMGELYIGGDGLARGYLNHSDLTAQKFAANPLGDDFNGRLYQTGDLARHLPDGSIELLGRIDQQVKIRGYRIELGEIETILKLHPSVGEAVVVAREDAPGDRRLVAYVAPASASASAGELRGFLKERLPAYMLPSAFVFLDAFPLTPNGKLDRKALPAPEGRSAPHDSYVAPRTPTEEALASIWCDVLNLKQVGVHDNFFELGGHSLLVVRVISEISRVLKANVTVAEVFLNPTVQQLTRVIAEKQPMERRGPRVITLREGDAEPAVYFIFANSHEFRFAQLFGEGRPVFGIEGPWRREWLKAAAENQISALPKIEEVVAPYVAALRAHAGTSPCILAGYCQGGGMAFEAAHQFKRQGGNVEVVFLFDAWTTIKLSLGSQALLRLRQIQRNAPSWSAAPFSKVVSYYAMAVWLKFLRMFSKTLNELRSTPVYTPEERAPFIDEQGAAIPRRAWLRWSNAMLDSYSPHCLDSRGVLVRSLDAQAVHPKYNTLFWQDLFARGMEVIDVPEGHTSIGQDAQKALALTREVGDLLRRH